MERGGEEEEEEEEEEVVGVVVCVCVCVVGVVVVVVVAVGVVLKKLMAFVCWFVCVVDGADGEREIERERKTQEGKKNVILL